MGIDVNQDSGVLGEVKDVVKLVNGKNKQQVLDVWHEYWPLAKHLGADFLEPPALTNASKLSVGNLRARLSDLVVVSDPPYDSDTGVFNSYEVTEFFQKLLQEIAPELPELEDVTAWGSNRHNGYEVPKGVAMFVFNSDQCFRKVPTKQGKKLKELLGSLEEYSWSIYSV